MNITDKVWTLKYAPKSLDDMLLSEENRSKLSAMTEINQNLLFLGRNGVGKTTLAKLLANKFAPNSYMYINASDENGIDMVRSKISNFINTVSFDGNQKIIILNEADGLSKNAQDSLRGVMEEYLEDVKFILTGNYRHKLIDGLISRCKAFEFDLDLKTITKRIIEIIRAENIKIVSEKEKHGLLALIKKHYPDIRKTINELQGCCVDGKFIVPNTTDDTISKNIFNMLKNKDDIFKIREYVISKEIDFDNDYHFLMRNLFDLFIPSCNIAATLLIADHMYKDAFVLDKEINFSALIFNLSKL